MRNRPTESRSLRTLQARVPSREPWLVGVALIALCAACLGVAAQLDAPTVAHWELADAGVLMSCAEEPSSNDEPLWCANPDSPQCTRGAPSPESHAPWFGPLVAAQPRSLSVPTYDAHPTRSVQGDGALLGHAWADNERLERPPRHT